MIFSHWLEQLGLPEQGDPAELHRQLRQHEDAGPLVRGLEDWLHRPPGTAAVDIAALLEPYRKSSRRNDIRLPSRVDAARPAGAVDGLGMAPARHGVALPFDHANARSRPLARGHGQDRELLAPLLLAVAIILLAGPQRPLSQGTQR